MSAITVYKNSDTSVFNVAINTKSISSGKAKQGIKADVGVGWGGLEGTRVIRGRR